MFDRGMASKKGGGAIDKARKGEGKLTRHMSRRKMIDTNTKMKEVNR